MVANSFSNTEKMTASDANGEKDLNAPRNTPQSNLFSQSPTPDDDAICTESRDDMTTDEKKTDVSPDGKRVILESECYDALGFSWPTWKKWMLLSSIFAVQVSMNFNTSVFPSAIEPISEHYNVSLQASRVGQCLFLVCYAFGCELWAPWSEEFGRWPILQ